MLKEFADWFSTKSPKFQKQVISKLEEVFQVQNNFNYIESLKARIKVLSDLVSVDEKETVADLKKKLSQANIYNGILLSEISELKDKRINLEILLSTVPRKERQQIKQQLITAHFYRVLSLRCEALNSRLQAANKTNSELVCKIVQLTKNVI